MAISLASIWNDHDAVHAAEVYGTIRATVSWDNSYPTGGESLTTAMINAALLASGRHASCTASAIIDVIPGAPVDNSIHVRWDSANAKLIAYVSSTAAQVANGTDISAASYACPIEIRYTKS